MRSYLGGGDLTGRTDAFIFGGDFTGQTDAFIFWGGGGFS
jgi:hypothetical protein